VLQSPQIVAAPNCVPLASLKPEELQRLYRFAAIPRGFEEWQQRNCYPRRLEDPEVARVASPVGIVATVAGHDAYVRDVGAAWLGECPKSGIAVAGPLDVTGSDFLTIAERMSGHPEFTAADVREVGIAKARRDRSQGGGIIWALSVGTPRSFVQVQCFDELDALVQRAAAALREAEAARR
jgi:hypothetical protein